MRTGVIAKKMGMTRLFQADGRHVPVTVLQLEDVQVVGRRDGSRRLYRRGRRQWPRRRMSPSRSALRSARQVEPKARVVEFRVAEDALLDVGATISADHFVAGQYVDISGVTQGKGFAGAMKRWGFGIAPSPRRPVSHRSHGSTGNRQDPGRVFKNKKMAGHMGARNRTQQEPRDRPHGRRSRPSVRQGFGPGPQGQLADRFRRDQAAARRARALSGRPGRAWPNSKSSTPGGFVDDAAVHEIPALPSDEEVKAIAAEQEAGAVEAAAEAEAEEAETQNSEGEGETPAADESKEG